MDNQENDVLESDSAVLVDNECGSSIEKESSKQCENDKEPTVTIIDTKTRPKMYGTSDVKKVLTDSEPTTVSDRTTRNFFFVEPLLFLMTFSMAGAGVCNKTLYLEKACHNYLSYSSDVCSNLTSYKAENDEAQKVANNFTLYSNLISMVPAALLTIFIGSWSDKYGRKLPIVVAFLGMTCQDTLLLLNSQYMTWPLSYLLLTSIPTGLTGSIMAVNTCVYSFVSEKTTTKQRTFKYAILELALVGAMPAGIFICGRLYKGYGYIPVYSLTLTAHAVGFLYTVVMMKDTKTTYGHSLKTLVSEFFSLAGIKDNVRTCLQVRENHGRAQIWLLIGSMLVILLGYIALGELAFYFCEKMYGWKMTDYSDVSTISIVVVIVVMVLAVPLLTKVFRVPDPLIGILGSLSVMGQALTRSFAYKEWIWYLSIAIGCFAGFAPLAVRSRLSKVINPDELGKVFSVLSSCESLVPIFGSLVFLQIYNASIGSYPGLIYLCGSILSVIPLFSFLLIHRWDRPKYQSMESGIDAAASSTSVQ